MDFYFRGHSRAYRCGANWVQAGWGDGHVVQGVAQGVGPVCVRPAPCGAPVSRAWWVSKRTSKQNKDSSLTNASMDP